MCIKSGERNNEKNNEFVVLLHFGAYDACDFGDLMFNTTLSHRYLLCTCKTEGKGVFYPDMKRSRISSNGDHAGTGPRYTAHAVKPLGHPAS